MPYYIALYCKYDGKTKFVIPDKDNAAIFSAQQTLERLCTAWLAVTTPSVAPSIPEPLNFPDDYDNTDLEHVCIYGDLPALQDLIAHGTDISIGNDFALREAADAGHTELVRLLLDHGADVHADQDYSLRWAADKGHSETVQLLLERGANVHAKDDDALIYATMNGHAATVRLLLEYGADCQTSNNRPLQWATFNDNMNISCLLAEYGVSLEKLNPRQLEAFAEYKENKEYLQQQMNALKKSIHAGETLTAIFAAETWLGHSREMNALWQQVPKPLQTELDFQHCLSAVTVQTLKQRKPKIVFTK